MPNRFPHLAISHLAGQTRHTEQGVEGVFLYVRKDGVQRLACPSINSIRKWAGNLYVVVFLCIQSVSQAGMKERGGFFFLFLFLKLA